MSDYSPKPEHKFTFGLWTVGNTGRDPFGAAVRLTRTPAELVYLLSYERLDQLTIDLLLGIR